MKLQPWFFRAVVSTIAFASSNLLLAQNAVPAQNIVTFKQRAAEYGKQLISPKLALAAGFAAAFGQYENSPRIPRQHFDEFPRRLEIYYSRRAARDAGELIAGYLHHEDFVPHTSTAHGFWRRTDAAFMSVLTSTDADGERRMAYAPIAGSFSSAFVGSVMYRHNETLPNTLLHAGLVYGHYFSHAWLQEFKPELRGYARRMLHRDSGN